MSRVGIGQDSHRFSGDPKRKLVLGGVEVPNERGLAGNSDADVVLHALCRALEQAIGLDSFSEYADEMSRRGINDSREYLKVAKAHIEQAGYGVTNIGLTIEAVRPRIDPIAPMMKRSIAGILGIGEAAIGINATTGEGMTPFGRGDGIQVFAIVNLDRDA